MGKPSATQLSRKSSTLSLNASISREKMTPKMTKSERKSRKKKRQRIQSRMNKLYKNLIEGSQNTSHHSSNSLSQSIIDLDNTLNTVIDVQRGTEQEEHPIVIPDDEIPTVACSTPKQQFKLHHSTPKKGNKDALLAFSNNNSNLQNFNENSTREINRDSYLTIDLTTETTNRSEPTVIDLADTTDHDVMLVSVSNASSMSGDSDVTVIQRQVRRKRNPFKLGIANMNEADKGKLLEMIATTIFSGCNVPLNIKRSLTNLQNSLPRAPETVEDTYIKEMMLESKPSRNSVGSNVYHPDRPSGPRTGPRMIVIDGSNVAMEYSHGRNFSVRGLQICIDYFLRRGHVVKAFVPRSRNKYGMCTDKALLQLLERKGQVVYTPSREINGRTITPYDDRYILQCAAEFDGVVVSGDNYRDLINENPRWRFIIENRLLPFTWVKDMIMFPRDPLGRNGPTLEQFLRHPDPPNNRL